MQTYYGIKLRKKGGRWNIWRDTQNCQLLWGNPRAAASCGSVMLDRPDIIGMQVYEVTK